LYKILAKPPFRTNHVHFLPSCHSTNETAQQLVQGGADEGTLVITDYQTAGKGQAGNEWQSDPGKNLTCSILLKPEFLAIKDQFLLTVTSSLALKDYLEQHLPGEVKIKWPNDIYFKGKKIAGILIENVLARNKIVNSIIGLGLNINQTEFIGFSATSMAIELDNTIALPEVLDSVYNHFAAKYLQLKCGEISQLMDSYHRSLYWLNEEHEFSSDHTFSGEILGTDRFGHLIVNTQNGQRQFQNKEIRFVQ